MNKKQAAEYLGVSSRQVENYAKQNKLSVRKEKGRTGDIAVFDEKELRKLKAEIDSKRIVRPAVSLDETSESSESRAIVRASDSRLSDVPKIFDVLKALTDNKKTDAIVAISHKPLLKLDEAAMLTGLSRDTLRKAIESGELRGKIIGRAYRIKRADLDAYIENL